MRSRYTGYEVEFWPNIVTGVLRIDIIKNIKVKLDVDSQSDANTGDKFKYEEGCNCISGEYSVDNNKKCILFKIENTFYGSILVSYRSELSSKARLQINVSDIEDLLKECRNNMETSIKKYDSNIDTVVAAMKQVMEKIFKREIEDKMKRIDSEEYPHLAAIDVLNQLKILKENAVKAIEAIKGIRPDIETDAVVMHAWLNACQADAESAGNNYVKKMEAKLLSRTEVNASLSNQIIDLLSQTNQLNAFNDFLTTLVPKDESDYERNIMLIIKYYILSDLRIIFEGLKKANMLNDANTRKVMAAISSSNNVNENTHRMQHMINRLASLNLLVDINFDLVLQDKFIDKSCSARTTGTQYRFWGEEGQKQLENTVMWSHYAIGAEQALIPLIATSPLSEIYTTGCQIRANIADLREENPHGKKEFGRRREKETVDRYGKTERTIANTIIYPAILRAIDPMVQEAGSEQTRKLPKNDGKEAYEYEVKTGLTLKDDAGNDLGLPDRTMTILMKKNPDGTYSPEDVILCFEPISEETFKKVLIQLDHFFEKVRKQEYNFSTTSDEVFLKELGKVIFYLARSYYVARGNGSIMQWIIRSLVKQYTNGQIDLGDIRIGPEFEKQKNIPYDIYAQLVDVETYSQAFANSLINEFKFKRAVKGDMNIEDYINIIKSDDSNLVKTMISYMGAEQTLALLNEPHLTAVVKQVPKEKLFHFLSLLPKSFMPRLCGHACKFGLLPIMEYLKTSGFDFNAKDAAGIPPIVMAASYKRAEVVEFLSALGVDMNASFNQLTALHWAAQNNDERTLKILLDNKNTRLDPETDQKETPLSLAVRNQSFETTQCLVKCGANTSHRLNSDETILHIAARIFPGKELEALLANTDVNARDQFGRTPLHVAVIYDNYEGVVVLLRHGANPGMRNSSDMSPLDSALQSKYLNMTIHLMLAYKDYKDLPEIDKRQLVKAFISLYKSSNDEDKKNYMHLITHDKNMLAHIMNSSDSTHFGKPLIKVVQEELRHDAAAKVAPLSRGRS